jgi:DNA-binding NtrC family response regulator
MTGTSTGGGRAVLAVAHDPVVRALCELLEQTGYGIVRSEPSISAAEILRHQPSVVLMDVSPDYRELSLRMVEDLRRHERRLPIILMGTDGSAATVVRALRAGAKNFFTAPFSAPEVGAAIRACASEAATRLGTSTLRPPPDGEPKLIGGSAHVRSVCALIEALAANDSTVLVTGETGTGKELIAQTIHARSQRRAKAFVTVSCPAVPDTLLESELFGHERGAFTGAHGHNEGKLAAAAGGTVFFDEIGDMTLTGQAKILGAIETRRVFRLGGHRPVPLDVRFIAATNADLDTMMTDGRFRRDLFYRLNVARVHLPPLRERRDDIPALLDHYTRHFSALYKRELRFAPDTIGRLSAYDWPGNIRELRNLVEALFASGHRGLVTLQELSSQFDRLLRSADDAERQRVLAALRACNWNKSKAAQKLHWSRMTLYRKLSKYNMPLETCERARD